MGPNAIVKKLAEVESHVRYKIEGGVGAPLTEPYKKIPISEIFWINNIPGLEMVVFDNAKEADEIVESWNKTHFIPDYDEVEDE